MKRQSTKGGGVSRTSTTSTGRSRQNASQAKERTIAPRQYKMTERQMRTWKSLDQDFKEHLHLMVDSCIKMVMGKPIFRKNEEVQEISSGLERKMVMGKPIFRKNEEVQEISSGLERKLKSALEKVKVPKSKIKSLQKLAITAADLKNEYENLTNQQLEIEREIRQEERWIESLEDGVDRELLDLEVPDDVLQLPQMVFSPS